MTRTATAPAARRTVLTTALCGCGCGNPVKSAKSIYVPGHDARHAGLIAREAIATGNAQPVYALSGALQAKALRMIERATTKAVKPAKVEFAPADDVKVGRWTYPARVVDGNLVRNTKRDGSGEWVAA